MAEKVEIFHNKKLWNRIADIVFPLVLVVFSLMHIGEGIDITDTGYNYGNYVAFQTLDDMWKFSTYLSGALGAVITYLPFGKTLMGLNFYTGLLKVAVAVLSYYFCTRSCKMNKIAVFLGEMTALGLCWCPTALIYNYLTYLLFVLGAVFIYLAVVKEKNRFFILAGIALAANVFVRFPNLAQMALIVAVWAAGIFYKKKFGQVVKETFFCILGYVIGLLAVFGYILIRYGFNRYVDGIKALFAMTEEAEGYTAVQMLMGIVDNYRAYLPWLMKIGIFVLAGIVLYKFFEKKWIVAKSILYTIVSVGMMFTLYKKGVFELNYRGYGAFWGLGVIILLFCLLLCGIIVVFSERKKEEKLLAVLIAVILLITPIGSNNHLYAPLNCMFLAAPFLANYIFSLLSEKKSSIMVDNISVSILPYKITLTVFCAVFLVQSVLFGANFVFRDGTNGEKRNASVENNLVLSGMKTTQKNASMLQGLNDYLVDNGLIGADAVIFGHIPAMAFYFQLEPAISSTWPDLDSYSEEKFISEIDRLEEDGERPIVVAELFAIKTAQAETTKQTYRNKMQRLKEFMDKNAYEEVFRNESFVVYKTE